MTWHGFRKDFAEAKTAQGSASCPSAGEAPTWFCGPVRSKPNANPTQPRPTRTERYPIESRRAGRGSHGCHLTQAAGIPRPGLHSFLGVLALHGFSSVADPTRQTLTERLENVQRYSNSSHPLLYDREQRRAAGLPHGAAFPRHPLCQQSPLSISGLLRLRSPTAKPCCFP